MEYRKTSRYKKKRGGSIAKKDVMKRELGFKNGEVLKIKVVGPNSKTHAVEILVGKILSVDGNIVL